MKNSKSIILAFLFLLTLMGCKQEGNPTPSVELGEIKLSDYLGGFVIGFGDFDVIAEIYLHTLEVNPWYNGIAYSYGGAAYSSPDFGQPPIDGGTMRIGGIDMEADPSQYNRYGSGGIGGDSALADPLFGQVTKFSLAGNVSLGIPAYSDSFYVPLPFSDITFSPRYNELPEGQDITITWNTDINNSGGVLISLRYAGARSHSSDPALPKESWVKRGYSPDDGIELISYDEWMKDIPVGGQFDLVILRGNGKVIEEQGKKLVAYSLSTSRWEYEIIE